MQVIDQNPEPSVQAAWSAYLNQDFARAGELWLGLMRAAGSPQQQIQHRTHYTYVLLAQGQHRQAYAILQELFEITGDPLLLHQLSCLARAAGDVAVARARLLRRKLALPKNDHINLADAAYEQGLLALLERNLVAASDHAHESLQHALAAGDTRAAGLAHRLLGDVMSAYCDEAAAQQHYQAAFLAATEIANKVRVHRQEPGTGARGAG